MSANNPVVYIIDDEPVVRETVRRMVTEFGFEARAFAAAEAFFDYERPDAPSCLLLDVMMPGSGGFDVSAELTRRGMAIPTVFMTGEGTIPLSVRAMKTGAVEFLTKPLDKAELRAAIDQAFRRDGEQRVRQAELNDLEARLSRLTARERDVLDHVVRGRLNKQIAADLGIVEQTVKVHRARLMEKLDVASVAELVRLTERIATLTRG